MFGPAHDSAYLPADKTEVSMKSKFISILFAIKTMFVDAIFVSDQFSPPMNRHIQLVENL